MKDEHSVPVYSTEPGRTCPACWMPVADCLCAKAERSRPGGGGIVRVRREVKGRNGKPVTRISGLPLPERELGELASELKRRCACGGSVKDGDILLQGERTGQVITLLEARGIRVKQAGG
ncbi:MAG TPA: stress response translation initiation inhibitor YciH [bacterium]|nr:stress response translation initiation inhibitor YciH [bacterium]